MRPNPNQTHLFVCLAHNQSRELPSVTETGWVSGGRDNKISLSVGEAPLTDNFLKIHYNPSDLRIRPRPFFQTYVSLAHTETYVSLAHTDWV